MAKKKATSKVYPKSDYRIDEKEGLVYDAKNKIIGEFIPGEGRSIKAGIPMGMPSSQLIQPGAQMPLSGFQQMANTIQGAPQGVLGTPSPAEATPQSSMNAFLKSQKPNWMEALGSGMAGFAAPFLGQKWSPPSGGDGLMNFLKFQALQEQRGSTAQNQKQTQARLIKNMALQQAYKEYGGSMMAGIKLRDPEEKKKFYARVAELEDEFTKSIIGEGGIGNIEEEEMDVDYGNLF